MSANSTRTKPTIADYPDLVWTDSKGVLHSAQAAYLLKRGISPEVAAKRGLSLLEKPSDWTIRGHGDTQPFKTFDALTEEWELNDDYRPMGIPLYPMGEEWATCIQLHPERPWVEDQPVLDANGKQKLDKTGKPVLEPKPFKFLVPSKTRRGSQPRELPADVHPIAQRWLNYEDLSGEMPFIVAEGAMKGDAILTRALVEGIKIVPISLTGVTMGYYAAGSADNPTGAPVLVPWTMGAFDYPDRVVYLCWDSDWHSNPMVKASLVTMASLLTDAGAEVRVVDVPPVAGKGTGVDDFLAHKDGSTLGALLANALTYEAFLRAARPYPQTDVGRAQRLVDEARAVPSFIFNTTTKRPMRWTGKVWVDDKSSAVYAWAAGVLAVDEEDTQGQNLMHIRAAITLMQSEGADLCVTAEELDSIPWLLNAPNGTIDLHTGELRPHDPADRLSRTTAVEYIPGAAPNWERFVGESMVGDSAMQEYLQRTIGQSLYGSVREESIFFWLGAGGNGKSLALSMVASILGPFSKVTTTDLILGGAVDEKIASLKGIRFAYANEIEPGSRLAVGDTQKLASRGKIEGRRLYQDSMEFEASHSIFFAVNAMPALHGVVTLALERRMNILPWRNNIPKAKRDAQLQMRLELEGPQILAWMVAGCAAWVAAGFTTAKPELVQREVDRYLGGGDPLSEFIELVLAPHAEGAVEAMDAYAHYFQWALGSGMKAWSKRAFQEALFERGVTDPIRPTKIVRGKLMLCGIRIRGRVHPEPAGVFSAYTPGEMELIAREAAVSNTLRDLALAAELPSVPGSAMPSFAGSRRNESVSTDAGPVTRVEQSGLPEGGLGTASRPPSQASVESWTEDDWARWDEDEYFANA